MCNRNYNSSRFKCFRPERPDQGPPSINQLLFEALAYLQKNIGFLLVILKPTKRLIELIVATVTVRELQSCPVCGCNKKGFRLNIFITFGVALIGVPKAEFSPISLSPLP